MEIPGIISALIAGVVIGVLGRPALPGRQHIPVWPTLVTGIVAAFIGSAIAAASGVANTGGVDWIEWITQIVVAMAGVAAAERAYAGGGHGRSHRWSH